MTFKWYVRSDVLENGFDRTVLHFKYVRNTKTYCPCLNQYYAHNFGYAMIILNFLGFSLYFMPFGKSEIRVCHVRIYHKPISGDKHTQTH